MVLLDNQLIAYQKPNKIWGHSERSKSNPRIGVAGRVVSRWQYTTVSLGSQKLDGLRRPLAEGRNIGDGIKNKPPRGDAG